MIFFKKALSYLYPILIKKIPSKRSGNLEVTMINGKLVIDSENANYSYGSLQKVLKKGLLQFHKSDLQKCKNILILGVAGGSVIETLQQDFKLKNSKITGVEIDSEIVELANRYFKIDQKPNVNIQIADAFTFIQTTNVIYDLIIIDIFNDTNMPIELFENNFWNNISNILHNNGLCLFNSITTSNKEERRNEILYQLLITHFSRIKRKTTHINELFCMVK